MLGTGSSQSTALAASPNRPVAMTHAAEAALQGMEDDDDPLAVIIRKACSRELTDLGLTFNSLNIKVVQSEVAESRRRTLSVGILGHRRSSPPAHSNRRASRFGCELGREPRDSEPRGFKPTTPC